MKDLFQINCAMFKNVANYSFYSSKQNIKNFFDDLILYLKLKKNKPENSIDNNQNFLGFSINGSLVTVLPAGSIYDCFKMSITAKIYYTNGFSSSFLIPQTVYAYLIPSNNFQSTDVYGNQSYDAIINNLNLLLKILNRNSLMDKIYLAGIKIFLFKNKILKY